MSDPVVDQVFAVVLAAGSASRFGATKQLAKVNGVPLVRRAAKIATEVCGDNTAVVVGHDWKSVTQACDPLRGFFVLNDKFADGLGSSIACAVRSLQHVARAIIVLLADQPLVSAEHLLSLCRKWSGAADEIVATAYSDTCGAPGLFPQNCFEELIRLHGDEGGRHLLADQRFRVRQIRFEPAAVDIDTPDDLKQILRNARS